MGIEYGALTVLLKRVIDCSATRLYEGYIKLEIHNIDEGT